MPEMPVIARKTSEPPAGVWLTYAEDLANEPDAASAGSYGALLVPSVVGQAPKQTLRQAQQNVGVVDEDPLFPQELADQAPLVEVESILPYPSYGIRLLRRHSLP